MSDTNLVTASFSTLDAARSARKRLSRAGFARNSIDIERRRDEFEVSISTRDENRRRVERILLGQSTIEKVDEARGSAQAFVTNNRAISLGLAGFMLYGLLNRS